MNNTRKLPNDSLLFYKSSTTNINVLILKLNIQITVSSSFVQYRLSQVFCQPWKKKRRRKLRQIQADRHGSKMHEKLSQRYKASDYQQFDFFVTMEGAQPSTTIFPSRIKEKKKPDHDTTLVIHL